MSEIETQEKQEMFADSYITANASNFNSSQIYSIKDKLTHLPIKRQTSVQATPLKNPILALILSLFLGTLGVDRFYLGYVGTGILKLITIGGCGIWTLIDWFLVMKKARNINYQRIMTVI